MQRQRPEDLSFPGPESNDVSDGSASRREASSVRGRDDSRTSSGRREVVAMACQPCRKRKTKCDGQRPTCSACVQRGHTNCFYDSSSDMRRTSALKKRIDQLLDDITSLRNIILSICRNYNIPQDPVIMQLIEQTLCHGKWSYLPELSRVIEQHAQSARPSVQTPQSMDANGPLPLPLNNYQPLQRSLSYPNTSYPPPVDQSTTQSFSAAVPPPAWSPIDIRATPTVYADVGQSGSYFTTNCSYRPAQAYPVSSNTY
ncbi:uncharacterized protein PV09_01406 [Verruconis gallopava]|uniref:Zn(2)-C6 fungal-type domain-containing protein n=1 Tax=Verruconis gallopava TaxID=253628 RepID=A0A0D1Z6F7_9PEZI|nr:uncharacterized protein PV09_01406 [Verruconis gallopava]KIW08512.1 hypothetical protein PV09_01406 [Verruconis gallopava]